MVGKFDDNGKAQIAQAWDNDGNLGLIIYGSDDANSLVAKWGTTDIGEGSGAVCWCVGDFNGDGKDEIVQG